MIGKPIEKAINEQINAELYSFYLYLTMAAHFDETSFKGLARWMRTQAQEEMSHAMKFFDFVHERGGSVTLTAIDPDRPASHSKRIITRIVRQKWNYQGDHHR